MMKTKWIVLLGVAALLSVGGGLMIVNSVRNEDAVQIIAETVKSENPTSAAAVDACIVRLINASVIHGTVRDHVPFNVWGGRFEVIRTEASVVCRSPGIFGIGRAEATR